MQHNIISCCYIGVGLVLSLISAYLAVNDVSGWGYFLFVGLLAFLGASGPLEIEFQDKKDKK